MELTIWVNGRWVLDASLFQEEMKFTVCTNRMKEVKSSFEGHKRFEFDRRKN